jgi:hypothetical protein
MHGTRQGILSEAARIPHATATCFRISSFSDGG